VVRVVAHAFGSRAIDREDFQAIGIAVYESQDRYLKLVADLREVRRKMKKKEPF
jgi:hypothetical protein